MAELNSEAFWDLLSQLDQDPEAAGEKYKGLRHKLVMFFEGRSCGYQSDILADRTLDRVAAKLHDTATIYSHSTLPAYCYGVARYVWKEWLAERRPAPLEGDVRDTRYEDEVLTVRLECVEHCLGELAPESRKLILDYYQGERSAKIEHRAQIAEYLGITVNALRRRAHWIRAKQLEPCLKKCSERGVGTFRVLNT